LYEEVGILQVFIWLYTLHNSSAPIVSLVLFTEDTEVIFYKIDIFSSSKSAYRFLTRYLTFYVSSSPA